jgi:phage baseplate assembly protein W
MAKKYFVGFSTVGASRTGAWRLYDVPLVRRDLLNHFATRVGERVMRPNWGCRIWDMLMEPMTPMLREAVVSEAVRICEEDTRVVVTDVRVEEVPDGLAVAIDLLYRTTGTPDSLYVAFERRQTLAALPSGVTP